MLNKQHHLFDHLPVVCKVCKDRKSRALKSLWAKIKSTTEGHTGGEESEDMVVPLARDLGIGGGNCQVHQAVGLHAAYCYLGG